MTPLPVDLMALPQVDYTRPIHEQLTPTTWLQGGTVFRRAGCLSAWLALRYKPVTTEAQYLEILEDISRVIRTLYPSHVPGGRSIEAPLTVIRDFNDCGRTTLEDVVRVLKISRY